MNKKFKDREDVIKLFKLYDMAKHNELKWLEDSSLKEINALLFDEHVEQDLVQKAISSKRKDSTLNHEHRKRMRICNTDLHYLDNITISPEMMNFDSLHNDILVCNKYYKINTIENIDSIKTRFIIYKTTYYYMKLYHLNKDVYIIGEDFYIYMLKSTNDDYNKFIIEKTDKNWKYRIDTVYIDQYVNYKPLYLDKSLKVYNKRQYNMYYFVYKNNAILINRNKLYAMHKITKEKIVFRYYSEYNKLDTIMSNIDGEILRWGYK